MNWYVYEKIYNWAVNYRGHEVASCISLTCMWTYVCDFSSHAYGGLAL